MLFIWIASAFYLRFADSIKDLQEVSSQLVRIAL